MNPGWKPAGIGLALGVIAACAGVSPARTAEGARPSPRGQVVLPSGRALQVEVADTPEKQTRGYMFRERISDDEGMVFIMDQLGFHPFWMKNCKVGLDILWLDENWRIVHLEKKVPPCKRDPCPSYQPMQVSLYVLEVRGGLAGREGLKLGDRIIYTPPPPAL